MGGDRRGHSEVHAFEVKIERKRLGGTERERERERRAQNKDDATGKEQWSWVGGGLKEVCMQA